MKKLVSLMLVLAMAAGGASTAFANVPMSTNDPKCIDIRDLGNDKRLIQLPDPGKKSLRLQNLQGCVNDL